MTMPAMLAAMMGGGALPDLGSLLKFPCAPCLLEAERATDPTDPEATPRDAVTIAAGSACCAGHAAEAIELEQQTNERILRRLDSLGGEGRPHVTHHTNGKGAQ